MSLTYGYDLKDGDKILDAPVQVAKLLAPLVRPGAALINHLPFCAVFNFILAGSFSPLFSVRYIPSWVPYFSYEPLARIARELSRRIRNEPMDFVKSSLVCRDHSCS
jgi:hypothetical protein